MLKRSIQFSLIIIALLAIVFNIHNYVDTTLLRFSLLNVYLFHAIAAIIVYTTLEFVAEKLPTQAGYAYLVLMLFKIGLFVLLFQSVFSEKLSQSERIGLVVPLFLFLITEAIAIGKLLNSK